MEHSNPNKLLDATYILYAHFGAYDLLCSGHLGGIFQRP